MAAIVRAPSAIDQLLQGGLLLPHPLHATCAVADDEANQHVLPRIRPTLSRASCLESTSLPTPAQ